MFLDSPTTFTIEIETSTVTTKLTTTITVVMTTTVTSTTTTMIESTSTRNQTELTTGSKALFSHYNAFRLL